MGKDADAVICKTAGGNYVLSVWSAKYVEASNILSKADLWAWVRLQDLPRLVATLRLAGLTVEVKE